MFDKQLLAGKRVLITGGGTGLGKSIGARYVELGADLYICGRRQAVLDAAARDLAASRDGAKVRGLVCDVRDSGAVAAMMDAIWADGPLDILINNAAGNFVAQTHRLSPRAIDAVLNVVLHGAAYCTVEAGRRWIDAGRGGVVLSVLTVSSLMGSAFTTPSAMAKAGVLSMTRSLAVEWGRKGIRLVAVAPGPFPTEGAWKQLFPDEDSVDPIETSVPLARTGTHDELANLCAFLASDGAAFITGECVVIDGGKQWLGGGTPAKAMLDWSDEQWERLRRARAKDA
ncbi:MAG: SDR family oxidoreductase [Hyphomonadaceae bacterium]